VTLAYYGALLRQTERIEAFRAALQVTVRPGDRVLEVGAGLGTFACFAAAAGAARVWAVDGNPVVHVAHHLAFVNCLADRVEMIRGWIPEVALPEPADVVIFEDFPPRGVDARVFALLRDVHAKYVAPGVRAVPARLAFYVAPVVAAVVADLVAPFGPDDQAFGLRWAPIRAYLENTPLAVTVAPEALLAPEQAAGEMRLDAPPRLDGLVGRAEWTFDAPTVIGGLAYWFDLELAPGVRLSNAPGAIPRSWGHLLLPLAPALTVAAGETLRATVRPEPLPDGTPGWLSWEAAVAGRVARGHEFAAEPAGLGDLLAGSPDGVPELSAQGRLEARVLALTDGRRTVGQIAEALRESYREVTALEAERLVARALAGRARGRLRGSTEAES
jgi:protein arginine N-methyltransferase 1